MFFESTSIMIIEATKTIVLIKRCIFLPLMKIKENAKTITGSDNENIACDTVVLLLIEEANANVKEENNRQVAKLATKIIPKRIKSVFFKGLGAQKRVKLKATIKYSKMKVKPKIVV